MEGKVLEKRRNVVNHRTTEYQYGSAVRKLQSVPEIHTYEHERRIEEQEQERRQRRKEIEDYKNGLYAEYLSNPKDYEESCNNAEHINYLKNKFPKKLEWTDDECYEDIKRSFDENMIKSNGDLLSIYNPNSKWNWYTIGGRFNNYLKTLSGKTTNEDYVSKIDWEDILPFAFVTPIGEWHERGKMGWWACVSNEKSHDNWEAEFKEFLGSLDEDTIVTVVDCHI